MKFKVGDKVKILRANNLSGEPHHNQDGVGKEGEVTKLFANNNYPVTVAFQGGEEVFLESDLSLLEKTLEALEVGDIIESNGGIEYKVLAKVGLLTAISYSFNHDCLGQWITDKELKEGYRVKVEEKVKEMTLEEVASLVGVPVEQIRIKD